MAVVGREKAKGGTPAAATAEYESDGGARKNRQQVVATWK